MKRVWSDLIPVWYIVMKKIMSDPSQECTEKGWNRFLKLKCWQDTKNIGFYYECHQWSRGVVESPPLEGFQTQLDTALSFLIQLWRRPCFENNVGLDGLPCSPSYSVIHLCFTNFSVRFFFNMCGSINLFFVRQRWSFNNLEIYFNNLEAFISFNFILFNFLFQQPLGFTPQYLPWDYSVNSISCLF